MAIALETIVKQLEDSGIVAQGKLENFIPPKAHPKNVEELVSELVKQNHLTKFQAQQVAQGKSKALILGSYTILDKIGAGGMGQVFKAQHRRMDRTVAIKMLPPAMTKDPAAVARFEREVRAAAKLEHPNIVTAHDADQANGAHFLVMQYVEGKDLSALVKKDGPFPVAKAVNYILQAARGLEFAHGEGVIHRDIKPANLLLDKKGVVKILDMGLARIDGGSNAPAQAELTGTGAVMGTVDYMAPEQAMSTRDADARADIYSLGCSLHYLIAGKATYGGESVIEKLLAHREKPIPNLRDVSSDVSEDVEAVFEKMVAKNIEDRYQTMTEVIADLEKCSSGQPSSASIQQSTGTNLDKSALTFFQNLQATPTIQKTRVTKPVTAKSGEGKQPPWKNTKVLVAAGAAGLLLVLLGVWVIIRDKDGNEVAKVKVPDGGSVKVQEVKKSPFAKPAKTPAAKVPATTANVTQQPTVPATVATTDSRERKVAQWLLDHKLPCQLLANGKMIKLEPGGTLPTESFTVEGVGAKVDAPSIPRTELIAGLADFKQLARFQGGYLPRKDSDLWAEAYASLPSVTNVNAYMCDITDQGLAHLARLPQLSYLNLDKTPHVTSAGLLALAKCSSLTGVYLDKASFDAGKYPLADLQRLQDALPTCRIAISGQAGGDIAGLKRSPAKVTPPPLAKAPFIAEQAKAHQEAWAKHLGTEVETINSVGAKMILIPPGEFLMGSTDEQVEAALKVADEIKADQGTKDRIQKAERPQHKVVITKPLLMSATEVTIGQFKKFVTATKYVTEAERYGFGDSAEKVLTDKITDAQKQRNWRTPGYAVADDSPVAQITWDDAVAYCKWLSEQEKTTYRQPTEAEWEYACRAGTTTQYSFGDDHQQLEQYGWYSKNAGGQSHVVGTKPPNGFGLFDMHGNLWEWCGDYWDEKWYEKSLPNDPNGPSAGSNRVIRGGNWTNHASHCRSPYRFFLTPSYRTHNHGFRCVRVAEAAADSQLARNTTTQPNTPVTPATTQPNQPWNTPTFQAWVKEVQAMPAEKQIEAVRKKLMELNPGFDGKLTPSYSPYHLRLMKNIA